MPVVVANKAIYIPCEEQKEPTVRTKRAFFYKLALNN
jgi:hypothetical protein